MNVLDFLPSRPEIFPHPSVGTVVSLERQSLRVAWTGTTWPAEPYASTEETLFTQGQTVRVYGRKGITLLISA